MASTGLCSASGFSGPTSSSRWRPSTQRSRNVTTTSSQRAVPSAEPSSLAQPRDHPEGRQQGRRLPQLDRVDPESLSGKALAISALLKEHRPVQAGRDARVGRRAARTGHHRCESGIALPRHRVENALKAPRQRRPARARRCSASASSIRPTIASDPEQRRETEPPQRAARPRPFQPAVESLARQHGQRQRRRQAPPRRELGRTKSPAA